jgi:recombinational DNA repair ATPase RecF
VEEEEEIEENGVHSVQELSEDEAEVSSSQEDYGASQSQVGEAEVGIIEEITLQNFMCHKHLSMRFGPNVNFIVGHNGSKFHQQML